MKRRNTVKQKNLVFYQALRRIYAPTERWTKNPRVLTLGASIGGVGFFFKDRIVPQFFKPRVEPTTNGQRRSEAGIQQREEKDGDIETVLQNLDIPWEVGFLPGGEML